MIRSVLLFLIALSFAQLSIAQEQITTFILVRHAEKGDDGSKDPDLSSEGNSRANRLAGMLSKTSIQAIYSTSFKRTRNTVAPLAKAKGLEVLTYEALKAEEIEKMIDKFAGGTIVVCGHSNTIPWTANFLTGSKEFKDFAEGDYNNILVVSVAIKGTVTNATWLTF